MVIQVASYRLLRERLLLGQRVRSYNLPTWEVFPSTSSKQPPETSALIVCWEKADSAVSSKVGLMSIHLLLPSLELAWLLQWRDSTKKACRDTRNGWWVLLEFFCFQLILHHRRIKLSAIEWLRLSGCVWIVDFRKEFLRERKRNQLKKWILLLLSIPSCLCLNLFIFPLLILP